MSYKNRSSADAISFECVEKTNEHAKLILKWRNDPLTLAMSFHQKKSPFSEFFPHFCLNYYLLKELPPLFAKVQGERVAFIRFRPYKESDTCEISIVVAPEWRGKGIGTAILLQLRALVKDRGYSEIYAEIKPENIASKKAFEKAGFTFASHGSHTIVEDGIEKKTAVLIFKAELTPRKKEKAKVLIIAEAGSNFHLGSKKNDLQMAKTLIAAAKEAGADVIKFQTYRARTLYAPSAGKSAYLKHAGIDEDIETLLSSLEMSYEMIHELAGICKKEKIEFMSSAFSPQDFAAVNPFVKRHKIASYEINHLRLLELAAKSGKPLILSTGASTPNDIRWAIDTFKKAGGKEKELTLLQCTAQYPAEDCAMHLKAIPWLKAHFHLPVGLSDHSQDPLVAPLGAVALGATVIEKHFTLDKRLPGPDHAFALTPSELKAMVQGIRKMEAMLGESVKAIAPAEQELYLFAKRRVQAITPIKKGQIFKEDTNIAILRPGNQRGGVHPGCIDEIVGKKAKRDIPAGDGIQKGDS